MPAWSGLWNQVYSEDYPGSAVRITPNMRRRLRRAAKGMGSLAQREILRALTGAGVGGAALKTHTQIDAPSLVNPSLGGVRTINTITDINRVTTAADQTAILLELANVHTPTFPTEKSGNSGGGKLGF